MENKILVIVGILGLVGIGLITLVYKPANIQHLVASINSFEDCKNANYQVLESYPMQCKTPEGNVFIQEVTKDTIPQDIKDSIEAQKDFIIVDEPAPFSIISSPLKVTGKARGNWFFEASFPIFIVDWDGKIIAQSHAEAVLDPNNPESTWMTTEFVEFQGIIEFPRQNMPNDFLKRGAIIFHNDNPSGLPENDKALEIPILFGE